MDRRGKSDDVGDFRAVRLVIVIVIVDGRGHDALLPGGELVRRGAEGIGGREPGGGSGEDSLAVGLVDADDEGVNEAELLAGLLERILVVTREVKSEALDGRCSQGGRGAARRAGRESESLVVRHTLAPFIASLRV